MKPISSCILLVSLFILSSCKSDSFSGEQTPVSVITGEISLPVKGDIQLPPVAFTPDISQLRQAGDTTDIRMVVYGGSFPAGSRNGGLYREGQLSSIPVLIAHQMQLQSFVSPLFDSEQGNGSGYLIYDRQAGFPSWKKVTNQTAIKSSFPLVLKPFDGGLADNISWPEGPGSASDSSNAVYYYPERRNYYSYLYRFFNRRGEWDRPFNYFVDSTSTTTHLVLNFGDLDLYIGMASYSRNLTANLQGMLHEGYFKSMQDFIEDNLRSGRKMVLFNQPDYLDFPFFHLYNANALINRANTKGAKLEDGSLLIPNAAVKTAFVTNGTVLSVLEDQDVLSPSEIKALTHTMNIVLNKNTISMFANTYKLPMVDMHSLYKKILSRTYYTQDGLFIDPAFPEGNFFSEDGIHPTAIGSAVIANETIKVINENFKTRIPFVNVSELARRL